MSIDSIQSKARQYANQTSYQISKSIDSYIEEMDRSSRIILGHPRVQQVMLNHTLYTSEVEKLLVEREVQNIVISFLSLRDNMYISLGNKSGDIVYVDFNLKSNEESNSNIDYRLLDSFLTDSGSFGLYYG